MIEDFSQLGLRPELLQAISELGYTAPTPIQTAVIPLLLEGHDVLGQAQTGTGKTAAFSLPILHALIPEQNTPQALVVAPTRELAVQVAEALEELGQHIGVRVLAVYGGQAYGPQISRLRRGIDVVVATPGRLLDLLRKNMLDVSGVQTIILDEADEMLSMGFIEDVETILAALPTPRQTGLFSATMPPAIRNLAEKFMHQPRTAAMQQNQRTVANIEERSYLVNEKDKVAALTRLIEMEPITSALIFARTRVDTGLLANELTGRGIPAEALSGDLSQEARENVLGRFREGKIKVLVATDVAARGLDIDDISHVFNFDIPHFAEVYVHRVGRTGRAGRTGIAITLYTPQERRRLFKIENYTRRKLNPSVVPTTEEITAKREAFMQEQLLVWLRRGRCKKERETIEKLVAQGYDVFDLAAAALKITQMEDKKRPIAPMSEVQLPVSSHESVGNGRSARNGNGNGNGASHGRPNTTTSATSHEEGMVRLAINVGKMHGVRPGDIVRTIASEANIPGRALGSIRIERQHTYVDVPAELVGRVLNQRYMMGDQRVQIRRNE
ncbi:MAG: DEAD/DEAH box helicase [Chloroflexi bacterium]|nr:DEAD/DEAH box helicase [Chloroflexota bacterium]